jgi:hypothetical protein
MLDFEEGKKMKNLIYILSMGILLLSSNVSRAAYMDTEKESYSDDSFTVELEVTEGYIEQKHLEGKPLLPLAYFVKGRIRNDSGEFKSPVIELYAKDNFGEVLGSCTAKLERKVLAPMEEADFSCRIDVREPYKTMKITYGVSAGAYK